MVGFEERLMSILEFMSDSPFLTFFIVAIVAEVVVRVVRGYPPNKEQDDER